MEWGDVIEVLLLILAVGVLVFINGFFVAAEFALVKVRDTQLEPLADQGLRRARMARTVMKNLDAYLSACQLIGFVIKSTSGACLRLYENCVSIFIKVFHSKWNNGHSILIIFYFFRYTNYH